MLTGWRGAAMPMLGSHQGSVHFCTEFLERGPNPHVSMGVAPFVVVDAIRSPCSRGPGIHNAHARACGEMRGRLCRRPRNQFCAMHCPCSCGNGTRNAHAGVWDQYFGVRHCPCSRGDAGRIAHADVQFHRRWWFPGGEVEARSQTMPGCLRDLASAADSWFRMRGFRLVVVVLLPTGKAMGGGGVRVRLVVVLRCFCYRFRRRIRLLRSSQ